MHHLAAFHESIDPAGVLVPINAVIDDSVFVSGDDIRTPIDLPWILGAGALLEATAPLQAQISSPTLRRMANQDIEPFGTGLVFTDLTAFHLHPENPVAVTPDEPINFSINSNPAAATSQYGLVYFGDGPQAPVTGDIFTVRATASVTNVLGTWVGANLAFGQDLPIGNYDVVGMRCVEATSVACRLVFKGGIWRPGVPCANAVTEPDVMKTRTGRMGVWGTYHTNTPPSIEILGAAGAVTPVIYLDLISRG